MAEDPSDVYLRYKHLRQRAAELDAMLQGRGLSTVTQIGTDGDDDVAELVEEFAETSRDLGDAAQALADALREAH